MALISVLPERDIGNRRARKVIAAIVWHVINRDIDMEDLLEQCDRFAENPILRPSDVRPSRPDLIVECLLNPGAFMYQGRIGLLLRVAERPPTEDGWISTPIIDPTVKGGLRILRVRTNDPDLVATDPRVIRYKGKPYLTTLSHLRLAWSDDGQKFDVDPKPALVGEPFLESYGMEDCRVTQIGGRFYLTYTAVSPDGFGVGLISTCDWQHFQRHGLMIPTPNKDCAIFPEKIGDDYYCLHRPSGGGIGGNFIWTARSPDLVHWGDHRCLARTREGQWDSARIGAGAAPIKTDRGWLEIYHGATKQPRYCLGLMLLDLKDPTRMLARSVEPIMEPTAPYEQTGFFGNVVFTNGHVVAGDRITLYYGASDEVICGANSSIERLLKSLDHSAR